AGSGVGWALGTSFRGMTGCKGMKGYHVDTKDRIDAPLQKQRPLVEGTFRRRVRQARAGGRAAFKLEELLERDRLLRPGMTVVDLGAAPGGWSQLVKQRLGDSGRVIALDVLPMQGIGGVEVIEGDFREDAVLQALQARLNGHQADLVLCDMAPNICGVGVVDQARAMYLAE